MLIDNLNFSYQELLSLFEKRYQKGAYHSKAFFKGLYSLAHSKVSAYPGFEANQSFARQLEGDLPFALPKPDKIFGDKTHIKFSLLFEDNVFSESVIIAMHGYYTLCLSSQSGCKWG
ncbi:MAG: hypothetical protein FWE37_01015 [Spirochaetaceae bacterium]|nr:hypothetical protein [Spirochaetaceae bacterium]